MIQELCTQPMPVIEEVYSPPIVMRSERHLAEVWLSTEIRLVEYYPGQGLAS